MNNAAILFTSRAVQSIPRLEIIDIEQVILHKHPQYRMLGMQYTYFAKFGPKKV